ncbi:MAG: TetR/AcrR family transcriptional regulator [Methyloligellaceae bacterium]
MGRPREFDPEIALDKAMRLFWTKGYHDTSIRDLVEHTGVNYYGLYGEFENKRGLFLAALDRYSAMAMSEIVGGLKESPGGLHGIRRAFARLLSFVTSANGQAGCMMCNTAVELAPHDAEAATKVRGNLKGLKTAFARSLSEAKAEGALPANADVPALGEYLATTALSVGVLVRAGMSRPHVERHIGTALSALE